MTNEMQGNVEREVIQDGGECELYNFQYTAKYGTGSCWVSDYKSLVESLPEFNGKSMKECLDFFKECSNNTAFRYLRVQPSSERERVRFNISVIIYSGGKFGPEAELTFEEYLSLGCPDKIQVNRNIPTSRNSLEKKAERGK